jgi:import receptor subunit TOM20
MAIRPPLDPFHSTYCSEKCHSKAEEQYQSLLFGAVPPATPGNPNPVRTKAQVEERKAAQEAFVANIKETGRTVALLVIRFVGTLIADEHGRLKGEKSNQGWPEVEKESNSTYSSYDYIERLRSLEIVSGPQEEKEITQSRALLKATIDGLEEFLNDEKYLQLKGKIAYNGFGVYYHAGRDERVRNLNQYLRQDD